MLVLASAVVGCGGADRAAADRGPAIFYVAPAGNDVNPGTEAQPFRTLARAVSALDAGDTLYVKEGTYAEALVDSIPPGRSWEHPVTVAAHPGHRVVLRPPEGTPFVLRFQGPQAYIIVDGLELDGANVQYDVVKITGRPPAHHIRLQNCEIMNSRTGHGVLISGDGADSHEILGCKIHDNGNVPDEGTPNHGLYIRTGRNVVTGNEIYGHHRGYGIHLFGGSHNWNVIRRNRIHGNLDGILVNGRRNLVAINTVWNTGWGITVSSGTVASYDTVVGHNTVDEVTTGIAIRPLALGTIVRNNIVQRSHRSPDASILNDGVWSVIEGNFVDGEIADGGVLTVLRKNRRGEARFVNRTVFDFHLQMEDEAPRAGVEIPQVPTDSDGLPWLVPRAAGAFR